MSVNKIEGVPEGWELVRIGCPLHSEYYVKWDGSVDKSEQISSSLNFAIVRKIEPPKPIDPGPGWRLLEPHEHKQRGDECNFRSLYESDWRPVDLCCIKLDDMVYRRRVEPPKPTYIPWTYETCPVGAVVRRKNGLEHVLMINEKTDICVRQAGCCILYSKLMEDWEHLDGTPCGTIEVQE